MAYSLERNESVAEGLRRIIREETDSAEDYLSDGKKTSGQAHTRDEAIHEARKSIKKIRAVLRLVRSELGEIYQQENARLRDVARRLSRFRDADAIIETLDDLKNKYKEEAGANALRSVRTGLIKRKNAAGSEEEIGEVLSDAASTLRKMKKRVKLWPLSADEYSAIAPGLEKAYRDGQQALTTVRKDPHPENFHELRKRVKDNWYHVRLLEGLWTDVLGAYEKSLKELETWLGNDHNLVVLRDRIAAEPAFYGNDKAIELVLSLVEKYQKELRDNSLSLAERIYEEKPREFARRMKHLWDAWRNEPESFALKKSAKQEKARVSRGHSLTAA